MEEQNKEILQLPATIESIKSRVDGTWTILCGSQELSEEQARILLRLNRKIGFFFFKETPLMEVDLIDIPETAPEFRGDKTPSQRLRSRMFVYFTQYLNKDKADFNNWYVNQLEKIGQSYLDRMEKDDKDID